MPRVKRGFSVFWSKSHALVRPAQLVNTTRSAIAVDRLCAPDAFHANRAGGIENPP